jgi:hypothetical protein
MKAIALGLSFNRTQKPILDLVQGAVAAYSLRKLRKAYSGNCVRIRRSNDNAETDIGFVNNYIDALAMSIFAPFGVEAYVSKWYDQSGNANDAVQATANNQPMIKNALTPVIVKKFQIGLLFNGTNSRLVVPHSSSINLQNPAVTFIAKPSRAAGAASENLITKEAYYGNSIGWGCGLRTSAPYTRVAYFGTFVITNNGTPPDPRDGLSHHLVYIKNGGNLLIYENGINYINSSYADQGILNTEPLCIGFNSNTSPQNFYQGHFQEIILFSSNIQDSLPLLYGDAKSYYEVL